MGPLNPVFNGPAFNGHHCRTVANGGFNGHGCHGPFNGPPTSEAMQEKKMVMLHGAMGMPLAHIVKGRKILHSKDSGAC